MNSCYCEEEKGMIRTSKWRNQTHRAGRSCRGRYGVWKAFLEVVTSKMRLKGWVSKGSKEGEMQLVGGERREALWKKKNPV